ncbi:hypothetical protein ROHU_009155 [Labeo rohita]|uniref:Fibronectin type-III domain-containing protein n=1 Tax=Labeo rohita TaxID=84645 RepID=A0A498M0Y5_LABRO|nr:hypothetical protein ROHU_009155 [Labeo rohita]
MKQEKDWTSQTVSKNQNTVTLTDLRPDTEYSIKCAAVGKLNYTTESDVTSVIAQNKNKLVKKSILIKDGNPARYRLQTSTDNLDQSKPYRKMIFGERDKNKPHKTILMAGETGTGKTTMINAMINYMLGVKREDKVWFEITDDQSDRTQAHSQTSNITVYGLYLQESPIDLTIIDTPGYGDTHRIQLDKELAMSLHNLSKSAEGIHEIHAVCLVIKATQNQLSDRQIYIFDAVQSLFGRDIAENIVLVFTHSTGTPPKNVLTAVKKAKIKCAVNDKNQPVYFLFDNCQSDAADEDEEFEMKHERSWNLSFRAITQFFKFLENIKPKSLEMTRCLLRQREQFEANVFNLQSCIQIIELKQNELKLTQEVLQHKERDNKNFEYEVDVIYKEKEELYKPQPSQKINDLIKKSTSIEDGNPARYRLKTSTDNLDQSEPHRKIIFGERNKDKKDKSILLVGETGTGKTKLINTIVNYILGVQREDKVWFEITDDQSDRTSAHSQTTIITVYGFYLQESPINLTIIDTPGYGDTRGIDYDYEIAVSLHSLSKTAKWIHEVDAVCLVINATQNRLSDRQIYIFDAVQSLFGKDIAENIVLLFTHSTGAPPKNALTAVKEAKIKCAVYDNNELVYFLFDNCQSDAADEEYEKTQEQSWNISFKGMKDFFQFLENIKPKTLKMTQDVLRQRTQLEANISNLHSRVHLTELKQNELKQTQEALDKNKKYVKDNENFEYQADVPYKEKVDINSEFWHLTKEATCCTVCEENCHYPGCWWVVDLSWCSVMRNNYCTVCTNKCHYSKHVKEAKIYVTKTKRETKAYDDLKKEYDTKIRDGQSLVKKLEEELQELEKEKKMLVIEAYDCVETLEEIALNTDSLITLQHIDDLIENLKEINEPDKAEKLENIKKRTEEGKHGALGYIKRKLLNYTNKMPWLVKPC